MKMKIYGVGIDDTQYKKTKKFEGKSVFLCEHYKRWVAMLGRCYLESFISKHESYRGASVCDEWITFSNFKKWSEENFREGCQLDKDLLGNGSKVYSPENCCFISQSLNKFITERKPSNLGLPVGVGFENGKSKFVAFCNNPFTKKKERLGSFDTAESAHLAWKSRKLQLALMIAESEPDKRIANALINKYS